jgi:hypothetical protein
MKMVFSGSRRARPETTLERDSDESPGEHGWDAPGAFSGADEALKLRAEGMSWRNVARTLNLPMSTVI